MPRAPGKTQGWVANLDFLASPFGGVDGNFAFRVLSHSRLDTHFGLAFFFVSIHYGERGPCAHRLLHDQISHGTNARASLCCASVGRLIHQPCINYSVRVRLMPPFHPTGLHNESKRPIWSPAQPPHRLRLPLTTARTGGGNPRN